MTGARVILRIAHNNTGSRLETAEVVSLPRQPPSVISHYGDPCKIDCTPLPRKRLEIHRCELIVREFVLFSQGSSSNCTGLGYLPGRLQRADFLKYLDPGTGIVTNSPRTEDSETAVATTRTCGRRKEAENERNY
jgi:hypothetical protein